MAKKVAKKSYQSRQQKPISKRTDWERMKQEVRDLLARLQDQPYAPPSCAYNSLEGVIAALLNGEIDAIEARQLLYDLTRPQKIFEREDWAKLRMEIRERVDRLMQRTEQARKQDFKELEGLFLGVMFGDIGVGEAADRAREMLVPKPIRERAPESLQSDIFEMLSQLQGGWDSSKSIFHKPEEIILAHLQGKCSFERAVFLINRLITEAKANK